MFGGGCAFKPPFVVKERRTHAARCFGGAGSLENQMAQQQNPNQQQQNNPKPGQQGGQGGQDMDKKPGQQQQGGQKPGQQGGQRPSEQNR